MILYDKLLKQNRFLPLLKTYFTYVLYDTTNVYNHINYKLYIKCNYVSIIHN